VEEADHLEDSCGNRKIISKGVFKKWYGCVDWIYLVQGREKWPALI
jgi:hypothetical protein